MFNEAHSDMPLKKYIRRWTNWVIDFHWIFTLKYFIEKLPTNKLYYFIKNYPILDNFILHWMWWSYSINKDLEVFTSDPFRGIGTTPWLMSEISNKNLGEFLQNHYNMNDNSNKESLIPSNQAKMGQLEANHENQKKETSSSQSLKNPIPKQPSKFFQYNEFTMKTIGSILFQNESFKKFDELLNAENIKVKSSSTNPHKKYARSNSYSSSNDSLFDQNKSDSDEHESDSPSNWMNDTPLLNYEQTCEYLKAEFKKINDRMNSSDSNDDECNEPSYTIHKGRSKSVNDDVVNKSSGNAENELSSIASETDESLFKEDELENTVIDAGAANKEKELSIEIKPSELVDSPVHKPGLLMKLDAQVEEISKEESPVASSSTELTKSEHPMPNSNIICSRASIVVETPQEQSVFEKFFKSFNSLSSMPDEQHKPAPSHNSENLNKIIDLLKKSNKTTTPTSESLIIAPHSPSIKTAANPSQNSTTNSAKQQPEPDLFTNKQLNMKDILLDSKLGVETPQAQQLTSLVKKNESSDLIKLLLKIDNKTSNAMKPFENKLSLAAHLEQSSMVVNKFNVENEPKKPSQSKQTGDDLLSLLKSMHLDQSSQAQLSGTDPAQTVLNKILSTAPINVDISITNPSVSNLLSSSSSSSIFSSSSLFSSSSSSSAASKSPSYLSSNLSPTSSSNSSTAKPGVDSSLSTSLSSYNSLSSLKSVLSIEGISSSLSSLSFTSSDPAKSSSNANDPNDSGNAEAKQPSEKQPAAETSYKKSTSSLSISNSNHNVSAHSHASSHKKNSNKALSSQEDSFKKLDYSKPAGKAKQNNASHLIGGNNKAGSNKNASRVNYFGNNNYMNKNGNNNGNSSLRNANFNNNMYNNGNNSTGLKRNGQNFNSNINPTQQQQQYHDIQTRFNQIQQLEPNTMQHNHQFQSQQQQQKQLLQSNNRFSMPNFYKPLINSNSNTIGSNSSHASSFQNQQVNTMYQLNRNKQPVSFVHSMQSMPNMAHGSQNNHDNAKKYNNHQANNQRNQMSKNFSNDGFGKNKEKTSNAVRSHGSSTSESSQPAPSVVEKNKTSKDNKNEPLLSNPYVNLNLEIYNTNFARRSIEAQNENGARSPSKSNEKSGNNNHNKHNQKSSYQLNSRQNLVKKIDKDPLSTSWSAPAGESTTAKVKSNFQNLNSAGLNNGSNNNSMPRPQLSHQITPSASSNHMTASNAPLHSGNKAAASSIIKPNSNQYGFNNQNAEQTNNFANRAHNQTSNNQLNKYRNFKNHTSMNNNGSSLNMNNQTAHLHNNNGFNYERFDRKYDNNEVRQQYHHSLFNQNRQNSSPPLITHIQNDLIASDGARSTPTPPYYFNNQANNQNQSPIHLQNFQNSQQNNYLNHNMVSRQNNSNLNSNSNLNYNNNNNGNNRYNQKKASNLQRETVMNNAITVVSNSNSNSSSTNMLNLNSMPNRKKSYNNNNGNKKSA